VTDTPAPIDRIVEAWRTAYTDAGATPAALHRANVETSTVLAEFGAGLLARQTTVRMHIDVAELAAETVDQVAADAEVDSLTVRRIVNAILDRRGIGAFQIPAAEAPTPTPAPVDASATKCSRCGMRIGYVNYRGHVFGWGCADGEDESDRAILAPQLAQGLLDWVHACLVADDEDAVDAFLANIAADPRVRSDAGPVIRSIAEALIPMAPKLFEGMEP
jgi:hypothetical protein